MGGGGTRLEGALARPRPGALAAVRRPGEAWALADTSEDRDRPSAPGLPRTRNQELSAGKENEVCCRGTPKPFPQGRGATGLGRAERRRSPLAWTLSAPPREPAPPWPCADSDPGRPQGRAGPASAAGGSALRPPWGRRRVRRDRFMSSKNSFASEIQPGVTASRFLFPPPWMTVTWT